MNTTFNKLFQTFSGCECDHFGGELSDGYCPTDCNQFIPYLTWFAIVGVITSTSKVGDTLITLRSHHFLIPYLS